MFELVDNAPQNAVIKVIGVGGGGGCVLKGAGGGGVPAQPEGLPRRPDA